MIRLTPRQSKRRLTLVALGALVVAFSVRANIAWAWGFDEHRDACREAYERACQALANKNHERLGLACDKDRATLFGQACAISGDLVDKPEELSSAIGGAHATNDIHYYSLALYNTEHFQPQSVQFWLSHQKRAIQTAMEAANAKSSPEQITGFDQAFYLAAFANHFLADSFASGHMGFNRPASTAGAAKAYHDFWNEHGRWVRSREDAKTGAKWFTRGDGHLDDHDEASKLNRQKLVAALADSVEGLLVAFIDGAEAPASAKTMAAWRGVPFEIGPVPYWHTWYWFEVDEPDQAAVPNEPDWQPIALVRRPARYPLVLLGGFDLQYSANRFTEYDALVRVAWGPYIVPGVFQRIYVGLRLGYGYLTETAGGVSTTRQKVASGLDLDVPFLGSSNGLIRGALAGGLMTLGWQRRSLFVGPRVSAELGPIMVSLSAGVSTVIYDGPAGWDWRQPAWLGSASIGYIWPSYFGISKLGIPRVAALGEPSKRWPIALSAPFRYSGLIGAVDGTREHAFATGLELRAGPRDSMRGALSLGFQHMDELRPTPPGQRQILANGIQWGAELSRTVAMSGNLDVAMTLGIDAYRWSRWNALAGPRGEWWFFGGQWIASLDISFGINAYAAGTDDIWALTRFAWRGGVAISRVWNR